MKQISRFILFHQPALGRVTDYRIMVRSGTPKLLVAVYAVYRVKGFASLDGKMSAQAD